MGDNALSSSAIALLPSELLAYIMELAHTALRDDPNGNLLSMHASHVSRIWRAIALSRGMLWDDIRMRLWTPDEDIKRASAYLERAGDARPLFVTLDGGDNARTIAQSPTAPYREAPRMLAPLLPHIARWRALRLVFDTSEFAYTVLSSLNEAAAPHLQTVDIMRYTPVLTLPPPVYADPLRRAFSGGLPSLRSTRISGFTLKLTPEGVPHILRGLSTLQLHNNARGVQKYIQEDAFRRVLAASPGLRTLALEGYFVVGDGAQAGARPVTLLALQDLSAPWGGRHDAYTRARLRHPLRIVYAPALRAVDLAGWGDWASSARQQTHPSVRAVTLRKGPALDIIGRTMREVFAVFPAVEELTILPNEIPALEAGLAADDRGEDFASDMVLLTCSLPAAGAEHALKVLQGIRVERLRLLGAATHPVSHDILARLSAQVGSVELWDGPVSSHSNFI